MQSWNKKKDIMPKKNQLYGIFNNKYWPDTATKKYTKTTEWYRKTKNNESLQKWNTKKDVTHISGITYVKMICKILHTRRSEAKSITRNTVTNKNLPATKQLFQSNATTTVTNKTKPNNKLQNRNIIKMQALDVISIN